MINNLNNLLATALMSAPLYFSFAGLSKNLPGHTVAACFHTICGLNLVSHPPVCMLHFVCTQDCMGDHEERSAEKDPLDPL